MNEENKIQPQTPEPEQTDDVKVWHGGDYKEVAIRLPDGVNAPEEYIVKQNEVIIWLKTFEGPLDLLLYLIKRHKMDVFDIPMADITSRYLNYLSFIEALDIDVASDFISMAATLIYIKSKMLLPKPPADDDDAENGEDPRMALVKQLLEYQKYKDAARSLDEQPWLGRDVFARTVLGEDFANSQETLVDVSTDELVAAFKLILSKVAAKKGHEVLLDEVPVEKMLVRVVQMLKIKTSLYFEELFPKDATRGIVVATFLAILELTKMGGIKVYQHKAGGPIFVEAKTEGDGFDGIIERFPSIQSFGNESKTKDAK